MTENIPIFDRVANNQTMDKHLFILQNWLGAVATELRFRHKTYLTNSMDTIIGLTFAVAREVSTPIGRVWPVDVPLVIP